MNALKLLVNISISGLLAIASPASFGAIFNVPCNVTTLRTMIATAEGNSQADTLNLTPGCIYSLPNDVGGTNGLAAFTTEIIFNGDGATIERANNAPPFRIMQIKAGPISFNKKNDLSDLSTRFLAESAGVADSEKIEYTAQEKGTYWFKVFGFMGASNTFNYTTSFIRNSFCFPLVMSTGIGLVCI